MPSTGSRSRSISRERSRSRHRSRERNSTFSRSYSRSLSRSRSPHSFKEESDQEYNNFDGNSNKSESNYHKKKLYKLKVFNAPDWKWEKIRDFIRQNTDCPILKSENILINKRKSVLQLIFSNIAAYNECCKLLSGLEIEGKKLTVERFPAPNKRDNQLSYNKNRRGETILNASHSFSGKYESNFKYTQLLVKNGPDWSWDRFRNYIMQETQSPVIKTQPPHVQKVEHCQFLLKFQSPLVCLACYKELSDLKMDGKKLLVEPTNDQSIGMTRKSRKRMIQSTTDNLNNMETYGLTISFLNSLDIKPPLVNRVFIANLTPKVTKEKLLEVFGFAGQIISVLLFPTGEDGYSAKVEFDHPVEAVQAVSMFNKQSLFGRPMIVKIDQKPLLNNLPLGLNAMGPGLGPNGEPLRGVRNSVEIEPLKQLLIKEIAELKALKTIEINRNAVANTGMSLLGNPFQAVVPPVTVETVNPFNPSFYAMGFANPTAPWQGLLQPTTMNDYQSISSNASVHNNVNATAGSTQSQASESKLSKYDFNNSHTGNTGNQSAEKKELKSSFTSDLLIFTNLPPSVSVQALTNKMQEIGDVVFAEITTQGRAVVRFKNTEDAHRCIDLYDCSRVDGQPIAVNFV